MPGDIILHMCTITDNHMMYGSWDMEQGRHNSLKFQKPHNFLGNKNFNRLLLDLLKIKLKNCSYQNYMVYHFFYEASNMQNIPPLEQMFNKGTDKSLSGLP